MISNNLWLPIESYDQKGYDRVRQNYHQAVQNVAAVGRAYLPQSDRDENATLQWVPGLRRLAGKWVGQEAVFRSSISFEHFQLYLVSPRLITLASLPLGNKTNNQGLLWLEQHILSLNLPQHHLEMNLPYELPPYPIKAGQPFDDLSPEDCWKLGVFFQNTYSILLELKSEIPEIGDIIVWPHHFDMSARMILKSTGDYLTDTSISVGFSPGDSFYQHPYFFVNSWPFVREEKLIKLALGNWHTDDWVGAVLSFEELRKTPDQPNALLNFYREGIDLLSCILLE